MRYERQAIIKDDATGTVLFAGSVVLVTDNADGPAPYYGHFDINDDSKFKMRQSLSIHIQDGERLRALVNRVSRYASGWRISFQESET